MNYILCICHLLKWPPVSQMDFINISAQENMNIANFVIEILKLTLGATI